MQALLAPLRELAEYEEIRNILYKDKKSIALKAAWSHRNCI